MELNLSKNGISCVDPGTTDTIKVTRSERACSRTSAVCSILPQSTKNKEQNRTFWLFFPVFCKRLLRVKMTPRRHVTV